MEQRELSERLRQQPEVSLGRNDEGRDVTILRFTPVQKGRHGPYAVVDRRDDEIVADDLPSLSEAVTLSRQMLQGMLPRPPEQQMMA